MNAEEVATRLRSEGYQDVSVGCPAITGSPYDYVYVYLTDAREEGVHGIISDRQEYEEQDGYLVGLHEHWEDATWEIQDAATLDGAVILLLRLIVKYVASGFSAARQ